MTIVDVGQSISTNRGQSSRIRLSPIWGHHFFHCNRLIDWYPTNCTHINHFVRSYKLWLHHFFLACHKATKDNTNHAMNTVVVLAPESRTFPSDTKDKGVATPNTCTPNEWPAAGSRSVTPLIENDFSNPPLQTPISKHRCIGISRETPLQTYNNVKNSLTFMENPFKTPMLLQGAASIVSPNIFSATCHSRQKTSNHTSAVMLNARVYFVQNSLLRPAGADRSTFFTSPLCSRANKGDRQAVRISSAINPFFRWSHHALLP